jgi:hypothetical protein
MRWSSVLLIIDGNWFHAVNSSLVFGSYEFLDFKIFSYCLSSNNMVYIRLFCILIDNCLFLKWGFSHIEDFSLWYRIHIVWLYLSYTGFRRFLLIRNILWKFLGWLKFFSFIKEFNTLLIIIVLNCVHTFKNRSYSNISVNLIS